MVTHSVRSRPLGQRLAGPVLALVAAALVTAGTPQSTLAWSNYTFSSADESLLVTFHNDARSKAGLRTLTVDPVLTDVARWRSKDMFDRNYFSHVTPDGRNVFDELNRRGYCRVGAGENIAWSTYPDGEAATRAFNFWMGSSGHRNNIFSTAWTHFGIGAFKGSDGKKLFTVVFAQACTVAATTAGTTMRARCETILRTGPSRAYPIKTRIAKGSPVTVVAKVSGGSWGGECNGTAISGSNWYRISAINGRSVKSLYGVTYLYAPRARLGS